MQTIVSGRRADAHRVAPAGTAASLVPSVSRAITLLERLAEGREPMSLARLATDLSLPKSSVHGLCNTLMSFGYLRRQDDGAFSIGPRVMSLAEAFVANTDVAREFGGLWKDAAHAPDETMLLSVLDGHDVVYVAARNGARPLGLAFNVGMRLPAHLAATGKAMLAFQDADAVRRLYPPGTLPRMARKGPRTAAELMRELSVVRRCGYSVDDESIREGVYCMGAPVFDAAGRPVAGIGVCINKALRGGDMGERHRRAVLDAARALSQRLGATAALAAPAESPARRKASKAANP